MDDYTAAADKLRREFRHFENARKDAEPDIDLLLAQAKRVRSQSTLVVRALARNRDATDQEVTSE